MQAEDKYKQKYNQKSNRLQNYDYSTNGGYFITICSKNREYYFGEIVDGEMILNDLGKIVYDEILDLPKHFYYLGLDEFIVMPNHLHLILFLNNCCRDVSRRDARRDVSCRDVSQKHLYNNEDDKNKYYSNISPQKGSLGNIVKLFKGFSNKKINKMQDKIFFAWQSNYYDRIIRNEEELQRIRKYIIENPLKWEYDKGNTENIFM